MDAEIYKLQELWRTGQITDAQFVERKTQLDQGALERNSAKLRSIRGSFAIVSYTKDYPTTGHEMKIVKAGGGGEVNGEVVEIQGRNALVQVFEGTAGIDNRSNFELTKEYKQFFVGPDLLGRTFNGSASKPIDRLPSPFSSCSPFPISGKVVNPTKRISPKEIIHTGITAIDVFCPLYKGSTLPIFSSKGLPHDELACQIVTNAKFSNSKIADQHDDNTVIIIATMGADQNTVRMYREKIQLAGKLNKSIIFAGTESQPLLESLRTPHIAFTTAEYFAVEREMNVLLVTSTFNRHFDACITVATGRDQLLPKRAPIWYYSELAKIFERAGQFEGIKGSITHIPIICNNEEGEDETHPVPDNIGSLSDGFLHLSPSLFYKKNIFPPIDVLQSSSRFFTPSVVEYTRTDHYLAVEETWRRCRRAAEIENLRIPSDEMSMEENFYIKFKDDLSQQIINQGQNESRDIDTSLDLLCNLFN